jgi:signal transduction histidine kinase/ActR/RegA family two-component response regulator
MFVGSLVTTRKNLLAFFVLSSAFMGWFAFTQDAPIRAPTSAAQVWWEGAATLFAVSVPGAVAGNLIIASLERSVARAQLEATRRAEALATLTKTQQQLSHTQKLELIGQLSGGIAHDMNNILTSVIGEASLLDDSVAEGRESILQAADHAAQLTRQLMLLGRRGDLQPRAIDLREWTARAARAVRRLLPSDIQFEASLPERTVPVMADPMQILQIMLNLASNARDAMSGGGKLVFRLESDDEAAKIRVSDDGSGITEEIQSRIFEPFFTTKAPGAGTGLGLSNVKQIISDLGGELHLTSSPGEGTSVMMALPLTSEPIAKGPVHEGTWRQRHETVLVVDDDVRVRAVVCTTLQRAGYQVLEANGPGAAEQLVAHHSGQIDVLITDVVMGEGGAATVIPWFIDLYAGSRILVISGYNEDETLRRRIAQGEIPFLSKPFTPDALLAAMEKLQEGPVASSVEALKRMSGSR